MFRGAEMNFKDSLPWEIKGVRPGEQADELGVKRGFQVLRVGEIDLNENTKKQVMFHFYHSNALWRRTYAYILDEMIDIFIATQKAQCA